MAIYSGKLIDKIYDSLGGATMKAWEGRYLIATLIILWNNEDLAAFFELWKDYEGGKLHLYYYIPGRNKEGLIAEDEEKYGAFFKTEVGEKMKKQKDFYDEIEEEQFLICKSYPEVTADEKK